MRCLDACLCWLRPPTGVLSPVGLAGWLTDRFYEAGADDVMVLLGDQAIPTSEAAQWTALAVIVGVYTGLALNTPKQSAQFRLPSIPYPPSVKKGVKAKASKDIEKVMKRMQQVILQKSQHDCSSTLGMLLATCGPHCAC